MLDIRIVREFSTDYPQVFRSINKVFLHKAGNIVLTEAQRRAPNDGGILEGSLHSRVNLSKAQVSVGTNLNYAPYVEYGTGKFAEGGGGRKTPWVYFSEKFGFVRTEGMKAQPYLRPALDVNRRNLRQEWVSSFRAVFRALGRL